MNTNSNSYTIIYAAIMVVIVAFLLAFVSSSLKSIQNANIENDTKKQILSAINVSDVKDADAEFAKYEVKDMLVQADGTLAAYEGKFNTSYKGEIAENRLHVFECKVDGATKYILPIYGAGLWGPIWGYLAFDKDMNTIDGAVFDHKGETPGLGAEIATPKFWAMFPDKTIFEGAEFVGINVVKGGAKEGDNHAVDALTGGTKTSIGLQNMIKDSIAKYVPFLQKAMSNK